MILSKGLLQTKNTFLASIKLYKFHSSHFHALHSPIAQYRQVNFVLEPMIWNVLSRLESTQAIAKDTILNLPNSPKPTVAKMSDGLPDIPVPGAAMEATKSVGTATETVTNTAAQLPDIIAEAVIPLNKIGEPPLEAFGLGSYWTPVGWIQRWLEFLHVTFDMPWWGAIGLTVVVARLLLFPLVITTQKNGAKMHNVMPKMLQLQEELQNARNNGNEIEAMKSGHKLSTFMQENKINPLKGFILPLVQAPIFLSFFLGLKKMANVPVESLTTGGLLWFEDLTLPDQYYLLPVITSVTLWAIIEFGVDTGKANIASNMSKYVGYAAKVIPFVVFPLIMNFPSGVCVYWATTNFVSLGQVLFLKIPAVRTYFDIDLRKKHEKVAPKTKSKGFIGDVKSSISNMRIARDIQDRERLDQASFERAGRMPPAKTFKFDPTKTEPDLISTKKKFRVK